MTDDERATADEAAPASAAESLRLIEAQRTAAQRSLSPDPRLIYWPWGIAWFVGFGLLYLRHGPHDRVTVHMPSWLPLTTLFVLMAVAFVVSGVAGARAARQISGESSRRGFRYGMSWFLGFAVLTVTLSRVSDFLPPDWSGLLWAALSVGLVATLYLAGGAIWLDINLFVLGFWLAVVDIIGVAIGPGWHSLVICLGGGGGLVVVGYLVRRREERQR